jgi:hypothetical protein
MRVSSTDNAFHATQRRLAGEHLSNANDGTFGRLWESESGFCQFSRQSPRYAEVRTVAHSGGTPFTLTQ